MATINISWRAPAAPGANTAAPFAIDKFLLTAVVQVNANDTYNDGVYEYDEIGFPFLSEIGRLIYEFELERPRVFNPDLSRFSFDYDEAVKD